MKNPNILSNLAIAFGLIGISHAAVLIDGTTLNGGFEGPSVGVGDSKQGFDTRGLHRGLVMVLAAGNANMHTRRQFK